MKMFLVHIVVKIVLIPVKRRPDPRSMVHIWSDTMHQHKWDNGMHDSGVLFSQCAGTPLCRCAI